MHTRLEASGLKLHVAEAGDDPASPRSLFSSSSPLPAGLCVEVTPSPSGPVLRVSTPASAPSRYVPRGSHVPLQVQATYTVADGHVSASAFSTNYVFGGRGDVETALVDAAAAEVLEVVTVVVALAPSFPKLWEEAAADRREAAQVAANKDRAAVARKVAAAVRDAATEVLIAQLGPDAADTVVGESDLVEILAKRVVPKPEPSPAPERGAAVQAAARSSLSARALAAIREQRRLSEAEFVAHATDALIERVSVLDADTARLAASTVYDLMYDVYYGTGNFPDRAPNDSRLL